MINGIQNRRMVIFYFLQPDKHGNLILRGKESPPSSTNRYIVEEYFPTNQTSKSFLTPSWTGESKKFIWGGNKSPNSSKQDRKVKILNIILKMFGYNDNTHPTLERIIRMTKGDRNNKIDFDMEMEDWTDIPNDVNSNPMDKYTSKQKEHYASMLQNERLLTAGQFEENSYPAVLRRKKTLKPNIKKNIKKLKCRCKNER